MTELALRSRKRQGELGQFFTAARVAELMASMFHRLPTRVRILDAGAGTGALTTAFVRSICASHPEVRAVEASLYEIDPSVIDRLSGNMCAVQSECAAAGVAFTFTIRLGDFIQDMSAQLEGGVFCSAPPCFDAAIANPPYRKITTESAERRALRLIGVQTSNLYTAFIAVIQRLLVQGGQLVAITPRSFCNGPYFRPFRDELLRDVDLRRIHVFESRKGAFREDSVLQENIIFHGVKSPHQARQIIISSSSGDDGGTVDQRTLPFLEVVHAGDAEKFIHIPSTHEHGAAKSAMGGLSTSLAALGVTVSTGRVVDFRLKGSLRKDPEPGSVPLLYPCHFNGGTVHWPKLEARKPNAIVDNAETRPWLVPTGTYLLTKRFTSKEERKRLVACLFDPEEVKTDWVGFENHLNYFHMNGRGLDRPLAWGLFAFLNSTVVDQYFRRFSGHTQVNATDLRTLAYPSRSALEAMGREMSAQRAKTTLDGLARSSLSLSQDEVDHLVTGYLCAS